MLEPLRYVQPVDSYQAKFSLQFGLSSILVRRRAGIQEYTRDFVQSTEIREAMKKVKTILDPEIMKMGTEKMRSVIEVELNDGVVFRRAAVSARGTSNKPVHGIDVDNKFRNCANLVLEEGKSESALQAIKTLETIPEIEQLTFLLTNQQHTGA